MDIRVLGQQYYSYGNYLRGFSPHTIKRYKNCLDLFQRETGVIEVDQVTPEMIRTWFYKGRTVRGWSAITFLTYYRSLLTFFKWCIREHHITNNPVADLECPRKEKKLPRRLTKQEALRLLEVVNNYPYRHPYLRFRNHALFATFIFAGLRRQEAVNLKLTDVDIENRSIFVRQGKGSKDRVIPMNETLREIFMRYLEERRRLGKTCLEFFASYPHNRGFAQEGIKWVVKSCQCRKRIVVAVSFSPCFAAWITTLSPTLRSLTVARASPWMNLVLSVIATVCMWLDPFSTVTELSEMLVTVPMMCCSLP